MLRVLPECNPLAGNRDKCGPVRRQLDGSLSAVPGNEGRFQFLLEELQSAADRLMKDRQNGILNDNYDQIKEAE